MPTWEKHLCDTMAPFGRPCAQMSYGGTAQEYLVFNGNTIPTNYSDDAPQHERVLIQLHLFAPMAKNIIQLCKDIKLAVFAAGFSYPAEQDASEGRDTSVKEVQHVVFEFEWVQATGV